MSKNVNDVSKDPPIGKPLGKCKHTDLFRLWLSYKNIISEYWEHMAWLNVPRKNSILCNVVSNQFFVTCRFKITKFYNECMGSSAVKPSTTNSFKIIPKKLKKLTIVTKFCKLWCFSMSSHMPIKDTNNHRKRYSKVPFGTKCYIYLCMILGWKMASKTFKGKLKGRHSA